MSSACCSAVARCWASIWMASSDDAAVGERAACRQARIRGPTYRTDEGAKADSVEPAKAKAEAFSFGEPVPVTDGHDFFYTGCWMLGTEWYEPPVNFPALPQIYRTTAHHGSAIQVKRNILGITPNNTSSFGDMEKAACVFGINVLELVQALFSEINDRLGEEIIKFRPYSLDSGGDSGLDPAR